jgi:hypothetical protein
VLGYNYWYPINYDISRFPAELDAFYSRTNWDGIIAWYAAPQQYTGKDAFWYTGRNAVVRSVAKDRREREGHKIFVLPSDLMVERIDQHGTPQRNCRWDGQQCLYDAHFGCGILAQYNNPAEVCTITLSVKRSVCAGRPRRL